MQCRKVYGHTRHKRRREMKIQDLLGYILKINVIYNRDSSFIQKNSVIGYAMPKFLECFTAEKHDKSDLRKCN
jgi:hypothetical protein